MVAVAHIKIYCRIEKLLLFSGQIYSFGNFNDEIWYKERNFAVVSYILVQNKGFSSSPKIGSVSLVKSYAFVFLAKKSFYIK